MSDPFFEPLWPVIISPKGGQLAIGRGTTIVDFSNFEITNPEICRMNLNEHNLRKDRIRDDSVIYL